MTLKKSTYLLLFFILLLIIFFFTNKTIQSPKENKNDVSIVYDNSIVIGSNDSKVEIIIYSSLTCPHCAKFHNDVLPKIKKEFVETGDAKIILTDFPLDLAALNASKIIHCTENDSKIKLLDTIYEKQKIWTDGNNIEAINENLKKIVNDLNINDFNFDECLNDKIAEKLILEGRIKAQKKYKVDSTPQIIINKKKYDGPTDFKNIANKIKKLI
mgnify:FL=1|tara:strand:+ start:491 stop:1132 length:642 start_codon:yes stop_codon:yes gene_type:complete